MMGVGFEDAFDGLFALAMTIGYRVTGDRAEAEDVAAEAMTRAFAQWAKVSGLAQRDAWVRRVATNLAIDVVRGKRRRIPRVATVSDHAGRTTDAIALRAALRRLPRRQRQVVALRYLADLEEAEVARTLEISVGSVKTHAHRAMIRLRATLGDEELEELHGR